MNTQPDPWRDPAILRAWLLASPPGLRDFLRLVAPLAMTTRTMLAQDIAAMRVATPALAMALRASPHKPEGTCIWPPSGPA